jgi:hypothetical protein
LSNRYSVQARVLVFGPVLELIARKGIAQFSPESLLLVASRLYEGYPTFQAGTAEESVQRQFLVTCTETRRSPSTSTQCEVESRHE